MQGCVLLAVLALAGAIGNCLVLPASKFHSIIREQDRAASIFKDHPLTALPQKSRFAVIRKEMRSRYPEWFGLGKQEKAAEEDEEDADLASQHVAEYDKKAVAFVVAELDWNLERSSWHCEWNTVQWGRFDRLCLACHTPLGVYVYHHDSIRPEANSGGVEAPLLVNEWPEALDIMLTQLPSSYRLLTKIPPWFPWVVDAAPASAMPDVYKGRPLAQLRPSVRSSRIGRVVHRVDQLLHPHSSFTDAVDSRWCRWKRDSCRILCKDAELMQDGGSWSFSVTGVNLGAASPNTYGEFDELLLALFTPQGIHVYKHDLQLGVKRTEIDGERIELMGPENERSWHAALEDIMDNLAASGCEKLACIKW